MYHSTISGRIRMSEEAFEKLKESRLEFGLITMSYTVPVIYFLDDFDYGDGELYIYCSGKLNFASKLATLLASLKDVDSVDYLKYYGEVEGDFGRYYVKRGQYCYVPAVIPEAPPVDSPQWKKVEANEVP